MRHSRDLCVASASNLPPLRCTSCRALCCLLAVRSGARCDQRAPQTSGLAPAERAPSASTAARVRHGYAAVGLEIAAAFKSARALCDAEAQGAASAGLRGSASSRRGKTSRARPRYSSISRCARSRGFFTARSARVGRLRRACARTLLVSTMRNTAASSPTEQRVHAQTWNGH